MNHRNLATVVAFVLLLGFSSSQGEAQEADPALRSAIAAADPGAGQSVSTRCSACHTFDENGQNRVGPNLYGVVGRGIGGKEGFNYSPPFQQLMAAGDTWTFERLDGFLADPRGTIPGTRMAVPGITDEADRHNLVAYLRTLSASPVLLE
ncbi:MAG: cytochrome c family protein [Bauldia sp.]|nr:cytochrome c family protein [Bauldia sp.]